MLQIATVNTYKEAYLIDGASGYALNRKRGRDTLRIITVLPQDLVERIDKWGVSAGMTSRREATETILEKGLEALTHEAN